MTYHDVHEWRLTLGRQHDLVQCPVGLFIWNGLLCVKTGTHVPSNNGPSPDAYIIPNNEYFWGGHVNDRLNRDCVFVTPVELAIPTVHEKIANAMVEVAVSVIGSFGGPPPERSFQQELAALINRKSLENGSDTPDFILANFIVRAIEAFDATTAEREKWYGRTGGGLAKSPAPPAVLK